MKTCKACKVSLPVDAFHASSRSADGLQNACSECQNEWRRVRVAAKRASVVAALPTDHGELKYCPRCSETKSRTEFHKNKAAPDGLQNYCKPCTKNVQREYQRRNADTVALRRMEKSRLPSTEGVKKCTRCLVVKPRVSFYAHRHTIDGRTAYCMECQRAQAKAWRAANRAKVQANNAAWSAANPDRKKRDHRQYWLKMYGLDQASYAAMLEAQGGVCAICQLPERYIDARSGEPRRLAVDHCHETNRVRGLLCGRCNRSIGQFDDDHERLIRAAEYLRKAVD